MVQQKPSKGICGKENESKEQNRVGKAYECTECGTTFRFQSSFLTHRKMHLREKGLSEQEAKSRSNSFIKLSRLFLDFPPAFSFVKTGWFDENDVIVMFYIGTLKPPFLKTYPRNAS
jgi:hypothetical protein